ncbi:hypothetical protein [Amycolatopsis pithecellobii]|uniref:Uncharacterized protein n=1 Tax=Amycolatopsis pithecellobii TaxID=664692 RepID=A0A6N7Z0G3_9PSEU|nr:hypothetical protein [Amycolatopsis pithecellobii]MTD54189.1 hypothetical protein [Amycolatopsis pithecellobii]
MSREAGATAGPLHYVSFDGHAACHLSREGRLVDSEVDGRTPTFAAAGYLSGRGLGAEFGCARKVRGEQNVQSRTLG